MGGPPSGRLATPSLARHLGQLEQASQRLTASLCRRGRLGRLLPCQLGIAAQRTQRALLCLLGLRRCRMRFVQLGEAVKRVTSDSWRQPCTLLLPDACSGSAGLLAGSCRGASRGCSRNLTPQRRSRKAGALRCGPPQSCSS